MNHFRERIPSFIDSRGVTPVEFDFETKEELIQHPYIQNWMGNGYSSICKSDNILFVVKNNPTMRTAIGWIKNPDDLNIDILD